MNETKLISKNRGIKDYKSMSEERLLSVLNESERVKESENSFDDAKIKKYYDHNDIEYKEIKDVGD